MLTSCLNKYYKFILQEYDSIFYHLIFPSWKKWLFFNIKWKLIWFIDGTIWLFLLYRVNINNNVKNSKQNNNNNNNNYDKINVCINNRNNINNNNINACVWLIVYISWNKNTPSKEKFLFLFFLYKIKKYYCH